MSERAPAHPLRLVCASANPDKVTEIAAILAGVVELLPRPDSVPEVVEDAETLEGNARLKAVAICEATGLPAVADDTGLEVAALGGAPGVHSARYADEDAVADVGLDAANRAKLLAELAGADDRRAAFRTCIVVRRPDGTEIVANGACPGTITTEERGERGFGYDSVFVPDEGDGRTFAEMTPVDKHAISHRGRALRNLLAQLT